MRRAGRGPGAAGQPDALNYAVDSPRRWPGEVQLWLVQVRNRGGCALVYAGYYWLGIPLLAPQLWPGDRGVLRRKKVTASFGSL
jgi:hypothetical protein